MKQILFHIHMLQVDYICLVVLGYRTKKRKWIDPRGRVFLLVLSLIRLLIFVRVVNE
jgi:hypothetical protein